LLTVDLRPSLVYYTHRLQRGGGREAARRAVLSASAETWSQWEYVQLIVTEAAVNE